MPIDLRPYEPSDLPALFLLDTLCFEPPFRFSREDMRRYAEAKNAIVRLAVETPGATAPERLAGFCIVHLERASSGLTGYIVTLDVHPDLRGRGLASALMRSVEQAASDAGAAAMALHVWTGNDAAIRLYQRLGYEYSHTAENFYQSGVDALVYLRRLEDRSSPAAPDASKSGEWRTFGGSFTA